MPQMSGARFIAEALKACGVTHVFFVPAIISRALVELEKMGIQRVITHGEKAAAYMADGYARIKKGLGVCMAQSVGAANLAAGLQDPYLGHTPVIAITGKKPDQARQRNAYQEIEHERMFEVVTKYSAVVRELHDLPFALSQAFRQALTLAPGPAHLDLEGYEGDIICSAEADLDVDVFREFGRYPLERLEPNAVGIEKALEAIKNARRPLIVAGGGVKSSGAERDVLELAEAFSIPVSTSVDGKGVIPDNHPLSVGCVGTYARECANRVLMEADLVIFIGTSTNDQVTNTWTMPGESARIIQVDIDATQIGKGFLNAEGIVGDAKTVVQTFLGRSRGRVAEIAWRRHVLQIVNDWKEVVAQKRASSSKPILTERLCDEISRALPKNAILVSDTGYSAIWSAVHIDLSHESQSYIRAAGSLGWAFPAALGAKCAAPDRPVLCFTGDGALLYHIGELETAKRRGINTVTVVNNNAMYAQSMRGVKRAYGNREGKSDEMYQFNALNFAKLAQDFGCRGVRVEDPSELAMAIREGLSASEPTVIDVLTDGNNHAPWIGGKEGALRLN